MNRRFPKSVARSDHAIGVERSGKFILPFDPPPRPSARHSQAAEERRFTGEGTLNCARHDSRAYDWRLWTLPEIRELLGEAGFSRSDVYWESYDRKTGKGNGVFRKRIHAPAEAVWIGVVVAVV